MVSLTERLIGPCGTLCSLYPHYLKTNAPDCSGCGTHNGKPFWGTCNLYICAIKQSVEPCGLCRDFPCEDFINQFDPKLGQKSVLIRAGLLAYRKQAGTAKYRDLAQKIGQSWRIHLDAIRSPLKSWTRASSLLSDVKLKIVKPWSEWPLIWK